MAIPLSDRATCDSHRMPRLREQIKMSLIRFGEQNSDVYVYQSDRGLECCGCSFVSADHCQSPKTSEEMIRHLELHRLAGDVVPEKAFERLRPRSIESC
jgi:hypothetical protein